MTMVTSLSASSRASFTIVFRESGDVEMVSGGGQRAARPRHWHIELARMVRSFGTLPQAVLADLVDLAICVYVADRLARRPSLDAAAGAEGWARHIHRWQRGGSAARFAQA
jgi:hypothetical protein